MKKVIAWVREHGPEYGADPTQIFLAGSSLGGHLASRAAFTPGETALQPGFEGADTSVAGVISLYGYYGSVGRATARPLHASPTRRRRRHRASSPTAIKTPSLPSKTHGGFVEQLRATSSSPVVYAELPGAQHGFDLFRSRRFDTVVDAIEAFTAHNRATRPAPAGGRRTPMLSRVHETNEESTMYAVIRAYNGNFDLADTLAEREEEIRQLIGGINGFRAYYLLKLAEGTSTISVFDDQEGAEESSRVAAAWLAENLPDLSVAAPYVTAGEVLVGF